MHAGSSVCCQDAHGPWSSWKLVSHVLWTDDKCAQVVRCFEDENVIHVEGKISPADDTDVINFELALADVGQVEKRLARLNKGARKTPEEKAQEAVEKETLEIISAILDAGQPARSADLTEEQKDSIKHLQLLTMKPLVYAANVAEDELASPDSNEHVQVQRQLRLAAT